MRILAISAAQKERKVTVKTDKGNIILQKFGKEIISQQNYPQGMAKSCPTYIAIKKSCQNSDYFNDLDTVNASGINIAEIKTRLKMFINREIKEI